MSERINKTAVQKRVMELEQAEREAVTQVQIIRTVLAELRALLAPDAPVITHGEEQETA